MPDRVGWHCTACNRYFQTTVSDPAPSACRYCDEVGRLRRIDHTRPPVDVTVGDVVACDIVGGTETYVVGEVVEVCDDRILVEARDGTGRYTVKPDQIVGIRSVG